MRTTIEVTDLTRDQWSTVQTYVLTSYQFQPGDVRVCVTFTREALERHVEMPLEGLRNLMILLAPYDQVRDITAAEAAGLAWRMNTPDAPTCDHGEAVVREDPSMFEGADPVRTYADDCVCAECELLESIDEYPSLEAYDDRA